ncbi:MFS transporter [Streptomyces sp. TRM72054]|nr:MFS transporter [Streptomyces sp. TRM72054]
MSASRRPRRPATKVRAFRVGSASAGARSASSVAFRLLLGVGAAAVFTGFTVAFLALYRGQARDRAMGWRTTATTAGGFVYPPAAGALGNVSWHAPFARCGCCAGTEAGGVVRTVGGHHRADDGPGRVPAPPTRPTRYPRHSLGRPVRRGHRLGRRERGRPDLRQAHRPARPCGPDAHRGRRLDSGSPGLRLRRPRPAPAPRTGADGARQRHRHAHPDRPGRPRRRPASPLLLGPLNDSTSITTGALTSAAGTAAILIALFRLKDPPQARPREKAEGEETPAANSDA